jgi:ankyrin repeat protein
MKRTTVWIFAFALLAVCGQAAAQSEAEAPDIDIWTAAAEGNVQAIKQHLAAGTDVNAAEPMSGGTPLMVAALVGHSDAVELLIENGANVDAVNYDGATALLTAAFFCRIDTVKLLLDKGAEVNAQNIRGETALDTVSAEWSEALEGVYNHFAGMMQLQLDIERIKVARPKVAAILREHGGKTAAELTS